MAVVANPLGGGEVEVQAGVQAAVADVAEIAGHAQPVFIHHALKVAQVVAGLLGRHGRVFPPGPAWMLAGNLGVRASALADLPHLLDRPIAALVQPRSHLRLVAGPLKRVEQSAPLLVGVCGRIPSELDQQPGVARGHQLRMALEPFLELILDQLAVERLKSDGAELHDLRNLVGGARRVLVPEHQQRAVLRARDQLAHRLQHQPTGGLGADECSRQVEPSVGQQPVKVVARDPPWDLGVALADQLGVAVAQVPQSRVDLPHPTARSDRALELLVRHRAGQRHPRAVVEHHLQRLDVVGSDSGDDGVRATGVVADHPSQRAAAVSRRVRAERQLVLLRRVTQPVENHTRLHPRQPALGIELDDVVHVLGEVEHHGLVDRLAREAGAAPPRADRGAESPAYLDSRDHVGRVARDHHAERQLPVNRAIVCVQGPAADRETNLAAERC